jgi:hypothetical protein
VSTRVLQASGPWWGGLEKACPNKNTVCIGCVGQPFPACHFFLFPKRLGEQDDRLEARALSYAAKKAAIIAEDHFQAL